MINLLIFICFSCSLPEYSFYFLYFPRSSSLGAPGHGRAMHLRQRQPLSFPRPHWLLLPPAAWICCIWGENFFGSASWHKELLLKLIMLNIADLERHLWWILRRGRSHWTHLHQVFSAHISFPFTRFGECLMTMITEPFQRRHCIQLLHDSNDAADE